jgi:SAM-dependent methyltransferase
VKYGWDHPETAGAYESFCRTHARYRAASAALVAAAALAPGQRMLDLGAGTGRTSALVREALGGHCEIVCVEPAAAMRRIGQQRVPEARWMEAWPVDESFDRVLCGAAIWQMRPLEDVFRRAAHALRGNGALVFNIPAQYLGEPDEPGGGDDPWLTKMIGHLAADASPGAPEQTHPLTQGDVEGWLAGAGLRPASWSARSRLTQAEYRDWLKIPVITDAWLGVLSASERAARIDAAFAMSDAASWRWEAWRGWTAWK